MKQRERKAAQALEYYEDSHGVRYIEAPGLLGNPKLWPLIRTVKIPTAANQFMLYHLAAGTSYFCWLCRLEGRLSVHHICGGPVRSDEFCNFLIVCLECHGMIQSQPASLPAVFRAKVKYDRLNTDWCRLLRLYGSVPFESLD